jgi:hypothetical protein
MSDDGGGGASPPGAADTAAGEAAGGGGASRRRARRNSGAEPPAAKRLSGGGAAAAVPARPPPPPLSAAELAELRSKSAVLLAEALQDPTPLYGAYFASRASALDPELTMTPLLRADHGCAVEAAAFAASGSGATREYTVCVRRLVANLRRNAELRSAVLAADVPDVTCCCLGGPTYMCASCGGVFLSDGPMSLTPARPRLVQYGLTHTRLKKRHGITDERQALYEEARQGGCS